MNPSDQSPPVRFVDANGLRFAYLEWGPSKGAPLVLMVHGFPDTPHTWAKIAPFIAAKGFRVVAPFTRGYAPSGMPKSDPNTRELGEDTVALISALGEQRAHLVGHDWGAEHVYAAAGLAPEKIITLTAVGIPHRATITPTLGFAWALRHFVTLRFPGAEARFAKDNFAELEMLIRRWSPTWKFTAADLEPIKESFRQPGTVHGALGYYRASSVRTPSFMKNKVTVPTLNFAGADDPSVTPATYESTRRHYTGEFEVAVIPGGHFCHCEAPDQFKERLAGFLAKPRP